MPPNKRLKLTGALVGRIALPRQPAFLSAAPDRKSTRLNSSHLVISYAVFCLKKKKKKIALQRMHSPDSQPPFQTTRPIPSAPGLLHHTRRANTPNTSPHHTPVLL